MLSATERAASTEQFLSGGGEMGRLIRSMDWAQTALGPVETWPQSLRTSVSLCLSSTFPILIAWGPETIQIYNDSYRPICGAKHPESMGQNFRICWETALPVVGDAFTRGQEGEGTYIKDQRMFLDRHGYLEEAFMTFSFAPIRDESGEVGGIFHPITETTAQMLGARRTQVLRDLGAAISKAKSIEEVVAQTEKRYEDFSLDLPFLLFYGLDAETASARLLGAAGLERASRLTPATIGLNETVAAWPLAEAARSSAPVRTDGLTAQFGRFSCQPYEEPPNTALTIPVYVSGQEQPFGFLVAGVSVRRALDEDYENFYELLANTFNTAVSNVYAYEQEQKRAEALAAIDRSKTAFFSNVSHEFRTPLTLMLGPLEELLHQPALQEPAIRGNVESTHRNAVRLMKLVNNLLDFSRVEADRVKANYAPVDLPQLTADLAASFRSIIEKAGMRLQVAVLPLSQTVYADREMWEKIVLNLLSNAFKYTLRGSIGVSLGEEDGEAVLRVTDTGIGIPESELPHMFERFHRVEQTTGRTHEGTGIGLSLVSELVRLHQGRVAVTSSEGEGSTFTVRIPMGKAHLQPGMIAESERQIDTAALKGAFLQEAESLLESATVSAPAPELPATDRAPAPDKDIRVLIVDDNNDMRAYLIRLLQPYYAVDTARHGAEALEKIAQQRPDLVISDIMMPVMDGKALLHRLKAQPQTADIPLIFLSARAGEEARIDGLEAGADDYLIKPFSAKELLSKVRALIKQQQHRLQAEHHLRGLLQQAPVAIAIYKGPDQVISLANALMLAIWGRSAEEVLQRPLFEAVPELQGQGFEEIMDTVYRDGQRVVTGEVPTRIRRNGTAENIFIKLTVEALRDEDGSIYGVMVVADDVTALVLARQAAQEVAGELEQRVELRTEELRLSNRELLRINAELEQYAYVTSHDLQEPLRKIQVFSGMLGKLPDLPRKAGELLQKVAGSSERMAHLIRDLLTFSRLLRTDTSAELVDLNQVLRSVVIDFELAIEESGAVIQSAPLPVIEATSLQMNQLFSNLLSNALKFRRPDVPPLISIRSRMLPAAELPKTLSAEDGREYCEITFSDNGIGFDSRYADQIFEVFKRLHTRDTYSGSGIGLALCRRIVQNHGGSLHAVSEEGKGTSITAMLPLRQDDSLHAEGTVAAIEAAAIG